jgi:iron complex transport system ATP-binding protein
VLGPNGSGKSLTLHTLAGLRHPTEGEVRLAGRLVGGMPRREVARQLGLLLQDDLENFPSTVLDSVLLGRHPHEGRWAGPSSSDRELALGALEEMDLGQLRDRDTETLSGGERRRLAIARLLVQDTAVLLLDEPTNHLDPRHQVRVLARLAALASAGRAVMLSLHDPSLALRFAPTTLLLHGDGRWRLGPTAGLLNAGTLGELFATPYEEFHSEGRTRAVLPRIPAP